MPTCSAGNGCGEPPHSACKSQVRQCAQSAPGAEVCNNSTWILSNKRQGPDKHVVQKASSGRRNKQVHGEKGEEPSLKADLEGRDLAAAAWNCVPVTLVTQKMLSSWLLSKATRL